MSALRNAHRDWRTGIDSSGYGMNISRPFIYKPVATVLLTAAVTLAGVTAYRALPVSALPRTDFPTITVSASLPGASPDTMASSVATPLERQLGRIAAVTEMTSASTLGGTTITLQFDLDRNIDAAARDVEAAINAARGYLPSNLPGNPSYKKVNPADNAIFQLSLTSLALDRGRMYDAASTVIAQKLSQIRGVGQVGVAGSALPGVRVELNPTILNKYGIGLEDVRSILGGANANVPKGVLVNDNRAWGVASNDQIFRASDYGPLIVSWVNGAPVRVSDLGEVVDSVEDLRNAGYARRTAIGDRDRQPSARREYHRNCRSYSRRAPSDQRSDPAGDQAQGDAGSDGNNPGFGARCRDSRWLSSGAFW